MPDAVKCVISQRNAGVPSVSLMFCNSLQSFAGRFRPTRDVRRGLQQRTMWCGANVEISARLAGRQGCHAEMATYGTV